MKRIVVLLLGIAILPALMAVYSNLDQGRPTGSYLASPEVPWFHVGTLTTQVTYPSVDECDCTTVDANTAIVVWKVPNWATGGMIKFETTADGDSQVVSLMAAAGIDGTQRDRYLHKQTDDYCFGGTLALTGGKQVARNGYYVDTMTVSDPNGVFEITPLDSGHDRVCVVQLDLKTFKRIAFVGTTIASKTEIYIYCKLW